MAFAPILMLILAVYPAFQLLTLVLLIRRLRRPELEWGRAERRCYALTLGVMPTVMLVLFTAFCGLPWKGEGHTGWFGVINDGWAGAVILPIWLVSLISLVWSLIDPGRLLTSKPGAVMILTMALTCLWYAGMPMWAHVGSLIDVCQGLVPGLRYVRRQTRLFEWPFSLYMFMVPLAPGINLLLLLAHVRQRGQLTGRLWPFGLAWLGGVAATVWVKIVAAMAHYDALPDRWHSSDCFVVSAAARGHRGFVGSVIDPATGRAVNRQLARLRAFEGRLRARRPRVHRRLRRLYNIVGPAVARRIRSAWAADVVYLLLKPAEWAAELSRPRCADRDIEGTGTSHAKGDEQ